ncbi:HAMP domain-containing protein [Nonomuraea rubra]
MAGRVLQPLRTITATAREITVHDLHRRLTYPGSDDETKDLAGTVDTLLDRLGVAFEPQRGVRRQRLPRAAHSLDLRTQLTFERSSTCG